MPVRSLPQPGVSASLPKAAAVRSNKISPFVPPTAQEQFAVDVASTHSELATPVMTRVATAKKEERQPEQAPMPSAVAEDNEYIELGSEPTKTDEYMELGPDPIKTDEYIELGPEPTETDGVNQLETIDLNSLSVKDAEKKIPELRDEAALDGTGDATVAEEFPFLGEMLAEMSKGVDSDDNDDGVDYPAPAPPPPVPPSASAWR